MRIDKNLARAVLSRIERQPMTADQLAAVTGYPVELIAERLRVWCEEGRCLGRIAGTNSDGRPRLAYRRNPHFRPAPLPFATVEDQNAEVAA